MTKYPLHFCCAALVCLHASAFANGTFTWDRPGKLIAGSGTGLEDDTIYSPNMVFPVQKPPVFANSQVWMRGGNKGPSGSWKDPRNFAYPYGCVSPRVKTVCGDHFRSSRGIQAALNSRTVDLFLLKAVPLYSSRLHPGDVQGLVAEARRSGSWLVFFGHDVTNEPNEFDMTPNLLSCAVRAAVDADLPILSINDALDHYGL